ncbi:uncharacterized protein N7473_002214 [Penicillium subrubescens]|jgi:hypothetical protein|uniref:uncharacterized protein n=1 Tax=Penicillium subrubescens TaxID=1316194 RepID=UPI002544FE78|nr:uncharacterized protein N7473_002214 [Penicillium subrubescens]KAJ5905298.1 hypothetical protein N7473_002214 [Penicillium subrubescens]
MLARSRERLVLMVAEAGLVGKIPGYLQAGVKPRIAEGHPGLTLTGTSSFEVESFEECRETSKIAGNSDPENEPRGRIQHRCLQERLIHQRRSLAPIV